MIFARPSHSSPPLLFSSSSHFLLILLLLLPSPLLSRLSSSFLFFLSLSLAHMRQHPTSCCIFELLISCCSSLTDIWDFISGAGPAIAIYMEFLAKPVIVLLAFSQLIVSYVTFSFPLHQSTSFFRVRISYKHVRAN